MAKPLRGEYPDFAFHVVSVLPSGSIHEYLALSVNAIAAIAAFNALVIERPNTHIQILARQAVLRDSIEDVTRP